MAAQNNNMEEILTSIRTTLAEETAKAGSSAPSGLEEISDEEVLALSEADVAAPQADETVDLAAFGEQGEVKMQPASAVAPDKDILGEGESAVSAAEAAPVAAPAEVVSPSETAAPVVGTDELDKLISDIAATPPAAPAPAAAVPAAAAPAPVAGDVVPLGLVGDVADLQVALPAEVLAAALRPLVQTWLEQNLSAVVERLVQAEISKLSENE